MGNLQETPSVAPLSAGGAIALEIRQAPVLTLIVFVPVVILLERISPGAHTLLFLMSVVAIIPLAALLSRATEAVAARTGDAVGGLLNATLGNLTELVIALAALQAGQYLLVKASIAGAIVTNTLFMLGGAFLFGGLKYHIQEFNRVNARFQACLLFLATIAVLVPSLISEVDQPPAVEVSQKLSLGLAVLLIVVYALGMLFSLRTHRELFVSVSHAEEDERLWPLTPSLIVLGVVTLLVALVSEIFVGSVQVAAEHLGMTPAFVGFIVVALVGAAAEMTTAFSAARADRLDLSVGVALGSAVQIALFVAPVLVLASYFIGPEPMTLQFWRGAVTMMVVATMAAALLTNGGHGTWYTGVMALALYAIFAFTLFVLPPANPL
ncbi:Ca2+:H+ antiporter [Mycoplana sp. BE70]|uniref:calcium/proton exchanger n=1 Tax=Mycoplana sp. BE70 TaxID=2817775 RepID=UPI002858FDFF|nr:calcium/proton exchanger [Mycoplana sp. BE70]MDR6757881.1 Ca2+:H+ antiporter [Mycoplana sp. BE70]